MRKYNGTEIAIIGMAAQFPGAANVEEFWDNLKNGRESIAFFSDDELLDEGIPVNTLHDPNYIKANAYLTDKQFFDSKFFDYLASEAKLMDPQMRIFHQTCWKALEDAGCDIRNNAEKIGLFAGGTPNNNWENYAILSNFEHAVDDFTASQLRNISYLCARISYRLNLQGPVVYLNTACSTSLVAVQRACMSLLLRECKMALAGGVSINNYTKRGYFYKEGMINSPDGHCRAFDASANGTVGGEGSGVVVLKRLEEAIADRDNIHAVILGSGINNDGSRKMSFTAPSIDGQYQCILKAIKMSKVAPESISYMEAHGTGTLLGDPNEVEALNLAFDNNKDKFCALGTAKSNIGHLDAAAGIAGLIKTVLALKNKTIPQSLNYNKPNPKINFQNGPLYVNSTLKEWKNEQFPLRAGVSSFGIGGTNAHLILEEAPEAGILQSTQDHHLLCFSARTVTALKANIANFCAYLETNKNANMADIACTLFTGRSAFEYRLAIVCKDQDQARQLLSDLVLPENMEPIPNTGQRTTVFMFSGQGSQYPEMYRGLYKQSGKFREVADYCFEIIKRKTGHDIQSLLFPKAPGISDNRLNDTEVAQPALFVTEYALSQVLMEWGIEPNYVIGHSLGEYVAACISGVFSLEDALILVARRGELMQKANPGVMIAIAASEAIVRILLKDHPDVALAAVNSSKLCVVSGNTGSVEEFKNVLKKQGCPYTQLHTAHAFHSNMMDDILDEFIEVLKSIPINSPKIPIISNLSGELLKNEEVDRKRYWVDHLRQTVLFGKGIETLCMIPEVNFIEIGPGRTLTTFVAANQQRTSGHNVINLVRAFNEKADDLHFLLSSVGKLWTHGATISGNRIFQAEKRRKIALPTYAFDQIEYPVNVDAYQMISSMLSANPLGKSMDMSTWFYLPNWKIMPEDQHRIASFSQEELIMVLADDCGVSDKLIEILRTKGANVVIVRAGKCFEEKSATSYEINPQSQKDYWNLFEKLKQSHIRPARIIHCWGICKDAVSDYYEIKSHLYLYSLHEIARLSQENGWLSKLQIVVLSNDLHPITGQMLIPAMTSTPVALLKVISRESPSTLTSHIDISLAETGDDKVFEQLYEAIISGGTGRVITLRHAIKWEQIYDQFKPGKMDTTMHQKQQGVYLVTGGLGDAGFCLARYMIKHYHAKIIVIGRTNLLPTGYSDTEVPKKNKPKKLQLLQSEGEAMYISCDVADARQLAEVITAAEQKFGRINGIIHAAGLTEGRSIDSIANLGEEDFLNQFASKIFGLIALKEVFGSREMDFCVLLSSLSTITGGLGLGAYGPANIFMDYFIKSARSKGELNNWISIDLDTLDFEQKNETGISPDELCRILEIALSLNKPQLVVSVSPLSHKLQMGISEATIDTEEVPVEVAGSEDGTQYAMTVLWKKYFGVTTLQPDDNFYDLGGDSLKALTMIAWIHRIFDVELTVAEFFNNLSIRKLSKYIVQVKEKNGKDRPQFIEVARAEKREYYPLSSAQKRLYFLQETDKSSIAYNMPQVVRLEGELDKERLTIAFRKLLRRHESLRTSFLTIAGEIAQRISETADFEIDYFRTNEAGTSAVMADFIQPFNLSEYPLIRVGLIKTDAKTHILIVDMHHIISDGVSNGLLVKDFMSLYNEESLPHINIQYKDFVVWQQSDLQRSLIKQKRDFWLSEFPDEIPGLQLPTDHPRPYLRSYEGQTVTFALEQSETEALYALAEREQCTLYMIILSVFNIFLSKLSAQEDIIIGTPVAGRQHVELENMIGMFVNMLPLRNYPRGELTFRKFLYAVKTKALECFNNQSYPYEDLIEELNVERDTSKNPLFDVAFSYQNFEEPELKIPQIILKKVDSGYATAKFDLTLTGIDTENQIFLNFEYCTKIFQRETIDRFIVYFKKIIQTIIANTEIKIADIEITAEEERNALLENVDHRKVIYPKGETLLSAFERQVKRSPQHIAVIYAGKSIKYAELNNRAERLAIFLQHTEGIQKGDLVGVLLDQDEYIIEAILAILKAGGVYVPLEPQYDIDRVNEVIETANLKVVITSSTFSKLPDNHTVFIKLDNDLGEAIGLPSKLSPVKISPHNPAYVMYKFNTDSTLQGVTVSHHATISRLQGAGQLFSLNELDIVLHKAPICSDSSIWESLGWIMAGSTVCLLKTGEEKKSSAILQTIFAQNVSIAHFTAQALRAFLNELRDSNKFIGETCGKLRLVFTSGEMISRETATLFRDLLYNTQGVRLIQFYGCEEASHVCYVEYDFNQDSSLRLIGKNMYASRAYVLDTNRLLSPLNCPGELYVAGAGLCSGYLNNDELTRDKFIENPYKKGEMLFRTGDWVKRRPDGNIEYLRRIGNEVRREGIIVSLDEVNKRLALHPEVEDSAVIVLGGKNEAFLVAYYVSGNEISVSELKKLLSIYLPDAAIPDAIVRLDAIPRTKSGKPDIKNLPDPMRTIVLPADQIEKTLLDIWAEVFGLNKNQISTDDNFFDLGLQSLKATKMIFNIRKTFNSGISLMDVFKSPSIKGIAAFIRKEKKLFEKPLEHIFQP